MNGAYVKLCSVVTRDRISYTSITTEEFAKLVEELKDYLIYVEGEESYSYDNSDDDRASSYSSSHKFGYYRELNPKENSEHLIFKNGKIQGVVFTVSQGYNNYEYYQFLFDGSVKQSFRLGYSASHSSQFIYVEKVSLVKRGKSGAPTEGNKIYFRCSSMDTSI